MGSHSTSSLPRRLKLTTSATTVSMKAASSGTKLPAAVTSNNKAKTSGKTVASSGVIETNGKIEAEDKYEDETGGGGGGQKKFSFVGLISEDLR